MDYNGHLHFIRYGNLGLGQSKNFTTDLHIGVNQFDQGQSNYVPRIDLGPPKTHACSWWRHFRCLSLERYIVKYPWAEIWYIPFFFCSKNYIRIIFAGVLFRTVGCDWYTYLYPLYFSSFLKNRLLFIQELSSKPDAWQRNRVKRPVRVRVTHLSHFIKLPSIVLLN